MMNDLEERLGADLRRAVEAIDTDLDTDALLASGRRARRGFVAGRVAVAGVAVVVMGTAGWLVADQQTARTTGPVVAGTSTPSTAPSSSASPLPGPTATMNVSSNVNGKSGPIDEVRVAATSDGVTVRAQFRAYRNDTLIETANATLTVAAAKVQPVRLGDHGLVALVAGSAWRPSLFTDGMAGVTSDTAILRVGAVTVTAIVFASENPLPRDGLEVGWEDAESSLQSTAGPIPSARVVLDGDPEILFRSEKLNSQGLWGNWSTAVKGAEPSDMLDGSAGSRHEYPKPSDWKLMQYAMLPPGSTAVEVVLGSADGEWTQATLTDGWVAVAAVVHSETSKTKVVTSLSFTDAQGVRHIYPVK